MNSTIRLTLHSGLVHILEKYLSNTTPLFLTFRHAEQFTVIRRGSIGIRDQPTSQMFSLFYWVSFFRLSRLKISSFGIFLSRTGSPKMPLMILRQTFLQFCTFTRYYSFFLGSAISSWVLIAFSYCDFCTLSYQAALAYYFSFASSFQISDQSIFIEDSSLNSDKISRSSSSFYSTFCSYFSMFRTTDALGILGISQDDTSAKPEMALWISLGSYAQSFCSVCSIYASIFWPSSKNDASSDVSQDEELELPIDKSTFRLLAAGIASRTGWRRGCLSTYCFLTYCFLTYCFLTGCSLIYTCLGLKNALP